jgi:hypothetical protein
MRNRTCAIGIFLFCFVALLSAQSANKPVRVADGSGQILGDVLKAGSDGVTYVTPKGYVLNLTWGGEMSMPDHEKYFWATDAIDDNGSLFILLSKADSRPVKSLVLSISWNLYVLASVDDSGLAVSDNTIKSYRALYYSESTLKPMPANVAVYVLRPAENSEIGLPVKKYPDGALVQTPLQLVF